MKARTASADIGVHFVVRCVLHFDLVTVLRGERCSPVCGSMIDLRLGVCFMEPR